MGTPDLTTLVDVRGPREKRSSVHDTRDRGTLTEGTGPVTVDGHRGKPSQDL